VRRESRATASDEARQGRNDFYKKRSKKLLHLTAPAFPDQTSPNLQKFFGSLFSKQLLSATRLRLRSNVAPGWQLRQVSDLAAHATEQAAQRAAKSLENSDQHETKDAGNDAIFQGGHSARIALKAV
jgi:hypothetical protein